MTTPTSAPERAKPKFTATASWPIARNAKHLSNATTRWLWVLATFITLLAAVYQRATGPTYPVRGHTTVGSSVVKYRLPRTATSDADAMIRIAVPDRQTVGEVRYRRYKSHDDTTLAAMERMGDNLVISLPKQPPAGKVEYQIYLTDASGRKTALTERPVVMRFKGVVPFYILHPHIFFMFFAMLVSTRCALEALFNGDRARRMAIETAVMLFIGGIILGPIVQKFAFGAFWTGWPVGHDLTDNKTAVAWLFWAFALWRDYKAGTGRKWYVVAAVVMLAIFSIRHSALGSEIDYTKQA